MTKDNSTFDGYYFLFVKGKDSYIIHGYPCRVDVVEGSMLMVDIETGQKKEIHYERDKVELFETLEDAEERLAELKGEE